MFNLANMPTSVEVAISHNKLMSSGALVHISPLHEAKGLDVQLKGGSGVRKGEANT